MYQFTFGSLSISLAQLQVKRTGLIECPPDDDEDEDNLKHERDFSPRRGRRR